MDWENVKVTTTELRPINSDGIPISGYDLESAEDYILGVLPDDRIVHVFGFQRIRVGAGGTGEDTNRNSFWELCHEETGAPGLYQAILNWRSVVAEVLRERQAEGKAWKRWLEVMEVIPYELLTDPEIREEILEKGPEFWVKNYTE